MLFQAITSLLIKRIRRPLSGKTCLKVQPTKTLKLKLWSKRTSMWSLRTSS